MKSVKRVTEEIARWAFEVHVAKETEWEIAFTNPTAGPWKLLTATASDGTRGPVHRFQQEELRPDLVIYSDSLKTVLIAEAKGPLKDLLSTTQVAKSVAAVMNITKALSTQKDNRFWMGRLDYRLIPAILWGSEEATRSDEVALALSTYGSKFREVGIHEPVLAIESCRQTDGKHISCRGFIELRSSASEFQARAELLRSLRLA